MSRLWGPRFYFAGAYGLVHIIDTGVHKPMCSNEHLKPGAYRWFSPPTCLYCIARFARFHRHGRATWSEIANP